MVAIVVVQEDVVAVNAAAVDVQPRTGIVQTQRLFRPCRRNPLRLMRCRISKGVCAPLLGFCL